jgi:NADH pyrophosphatase NudC (nudix superfamily)
VTDEKEYKICPYCGNKVYFGYEEHVLICKFKR